MDPSSSKSASLCQETRISRPLPRYRTTKRVSRRLATCAVTALFCTNAAAVLITVPAASAGQVVPNGSWSANSFSASGKVNGTDTSVCAPGIAMSTSSQSGNSLGFSFIGTSVQVVTASGPRSSLYQLTLDGIASRVGVFSGEDRCGISFTAQNLSNQPHTVEVSLLQAGPVDVIAFRYDDGKPPSTTSTPNPSGTSGAQKPAESGGSNTAAIVGGVVGGVLVGLALAALVSWFFLRNRRNSRDPARENQELLATPYGAPSIAPSRSTVFTGSGSGAAGVGYGRQTYYNNATSYYPSEASQAAAWAAAGGAVPPAPVSNVTTSSGHRTAGGALHEEDLERIAAHVAAMVSPAVRASQAQHAYTSDDQAGYGSGSSVSGYNGPDPTPTSGTPTQRSAKAEYIRSQQQRDSPGVNRPPEAREGKRPGGGPGRPGQPPGGTPDEPPPAY